VHPDRRLDSTSARETERRLWTVLPAAGGRDLDLLMAPKLCGTRPPGMICGSPELIAIPAITWRTMPRNIARYVGGFVVVETTDTAYLGTLRLLDDEHVVVHTGFVGRPPILALDDIEKITLAADHADVAA